MAGQIYFDLSKRRIDQKFRDRDSVEERHMSKLQRNLTRRHVHIYIALQLMVNI